MIGGIYSFTGGLLLADEEAATEPTHITIVGKQDAPSAAKLFESAQKCPTSYKILEWLPPGTTDNGETRFPDNDRAAAYLYTENRCSPPKFTPGDLAASFGKK